MASAETGGTQPADRLLLPGKQIVLDAPPNGVSLSPPASLARVEPAEGTSSNAWEEGQLEFVNEPLNLAVERVNRYSSKIHIVTTAEAANVRISGVFTAGDTETFIGGVTGAFPVGQLREKNQVILVKREAAPPKNQNSKN
jgi:transmembrane sensor